MGNDDASEKHTGLWVGGGCFVAILVSPLALIVAALLAAGVVANALFNTLFGGLFGTLFGGAGDGGSGGGIGDKASFIAKWESINPENDDGFPADPNGQLKTDQVPPEYVSWVIRAGAVCPQIGPAVIAAQIEQESGWNPRAVSPIGAEGLSQFIPGTWQTWGRDEDGNGVASPFDPGDAIMAQARYDCALADQVSGYLSNGKATGPVLDLTLAAYNAGPGAVEQYGGVPPFAETTGYVSRIKSLLAKYTAAPTGGGGGTSAELPPGQRLAHPLSGNLQVTSPFGERVHPVTGVRKQHTGADLAAASGEPVLAARAGTVTFAGWNDAYGNRVVIDHGTVDGKHLETTYNHMSALSVSVGQSVAAGDQVGAVGATGLATGPHLHFEVRLDGSYVDPVPWLGLEG